VSVELKNAKPVLGHIKTVRAFGTEEAEGKKKRRQIVVLFCDLWNEQRSDTATA
jgi:hypothetical protein